MASRIPPLLPASPPPMIRDDSNEEEVDIDEYGQVDDDDFGDFSTASSVRHSTSISTICDNSISNLSHIDESVQSISRDDETIVIQSTSPILLLTSSSSNESRTTPKTSPESMTDESKIYSGNNFSNDSIEDGTMHVSIADFTLSHANNVINEKNLNVCSTSNDINDENVSDNFIYSNQTQISNESQVIDNVSLTDSDSIDLRIDSFVHCDEENKEKEMNTSILTGNDSSKSSSPVFSANVNDMRESSPIALRKDGDAEYLSSETRIMDTDSPDEASVELSQNEKNNNSDDLFQDFVQVSATFSNEQVNEADFGFLTDSVEQSIRSLPCETEKFPNECQLEEVDSSQSTSEFGVVDDFSDFISPTSFESFEQSGDGKSEAVRVKNEEFQNTVSSSTISEGFVFRAVGEFEQDFKNLQSGVLNWSEIFSTSVEDPIEVNVNSIEGKLKCSSVWCKIKDIETSPALNYNWNDSEANKLLLATLSVDSRNILFGPRWNSEVPRFASNLGFTPLVPQKAAEKCSQNFSEFPDVLIESTVEISSSFPEPNIVPSVVPDAHFDWNNSGLTNPLDSYSYSTLLDLDLLASFDIHSPHYRKKRKPEKIADPENYELQSNLSIPNGSKTKMLSTEASNILNNLPDLMVMEKQYIVFPLR